VIALGLLAGAQPVRAQSPTISCGETLAGFLAIGEVDTFDFDAQQNEAISITTQETAGVFQACWRVLVPCGGDLGIVCGQAARTLPTTGTTPSRSSIAPATRAARRHDPTVTMGAGPGSGDDPTQHGASLRLRSQTGGFDVTYDLESIGWRPLKKRDPNKGWKYTKGNAIKIAVLKSGKLLRIVGRGAALQHALTADPNPVDVVLSLGARRYCLEFGGRTAFKAGKSFVARDAAPPIKCADPAP
jgi:hypothetical protein